MLDEKVNIDISEFLKRGAKNLTEAFALSIDIPSYLRKFV